MNLEYLIERSPYQFKKRKNMAHNLKMFAPIVVMFIIGGLQALHGVGGYGSWVETVLAVFVALEHGMNGKTNM